MDEFIILGDEVTYYTSVTVTKNVGLLNVDNEVKELKEKMQILHNTLIKEEDIK